ncbi:putative plasma membrane sensor transducer [Aspergillus mulundensis]|uniref:Putative plasma membrane sensor transducer n=1 Tax=Aspergillus mulundensis TaxID=1810919 RepID=A0A3D8QEX6_9EURO|nr:putative plasma membrane sensor transducer [Aspergillus mulundensis]RDW60406.1 putative plasma membrane sensor transducer [Aspergillus mulundensis]
MKSLTLSSVFATAALLLAGSSPAAAQQQTYVGCFSSSTPLEDQGAYTYQSNGYCMNLCYGKNKAVFGLYNGNHCLCGDEIPAKADKEDNDDECNKSCAAWPIVMCGGSDAYSIYLTGYSDSVAYYSDSSTSTTSSSNSSSTSTTSGGNSTTTNANGSVATTATVSAGGDSESVTSTASADTDSSGKKDGPNTAAIAAGVVIGVVGLAALVGAGFFLWRFKKRHPADQRMREMSNVEQFGKPMSQDSMSDTRFDGDFMAQRRQSNGSIDDDRDFSRRILQVTNPDRH